MKEKSVVDRLIDSMDQGLRKIQNGEELPMRVVEPLEKVHDKWFTVLGIIAMAALAVVYLVLSWYVVRGN